MENNKAGSIQLEDRHNQQQQQPAYEHSQFKDHVVQAVTAIRLQQADDVWVLETQTYTSLTLQIYTNTAEEVTACISHYHCHITAVSKQQQSINQSINQ